MTTATLVIGLVSATLLLFGGAAGACTGAVAEVVEEMAGEDIDDSEDAITSTTEDVFGAGIFAVFLAFFLYIGAGLAKAALKTSTVLLTLGFLGCVWLVIIDTTSAFATVYYICIVTTGVCSGLMITAYLRSRRTGTEVA